MACIWATPQRLVTRHYVSLVFNLPNSYKNKIAAIPGVQNTTISNWFGGVYRGDMKYFFPNMAVEPEPFLADLSRGHAAGRPEAGVAARRAGLHHRPQDSLKNGDGRSATISSWRASFPPIAWASPSTL